MYGVRVAVMVAVAAPIHRCAQSPIDTEMRLQRKPKRCRMCNEYDIVRDAINIQIT